jgi:hypothetical protein
MKSLVLIGRVSPGFIAGTQNFSVALIVIVVDFAGWEVSGDK